MLSIDFVEEFRVKRCCHVLMRGAQSKFSEKLVVVVN